MKATKRKKYTAQELIARGLLLTIKDILSRGWTRTEIRELLPQPKYVDSIPYWRLIDIEEAESDYGFYADEG